MENFKWLHFSDLHLSCASFNERKAKKKLLEFIKHEYESGNLEYDYVFISGDIANQGVYKGTKKFLTDLFLALGLENTEEGLKKVFWSVGNHDIHRKKDSKRYELIQNIRSLDNSLTLADCLDEDKEDDVNQNEEERTLFINAGMKLFKDMHRDILKRDYEINREEPHIFIPLPQLNLIVLNTCLTSADKEDTHNLYIKSEQLWEVFNNIKEEDKRKPIFVLGHHGRDFFEMGEMDELSDVFDEKGVDIYLCGHNHRLGFAQFPDTERDIYQFTCGGGDKFSKGAVFSFMHGEFNGNDCSIHITPYSYRDSGNKKWAIDYELNKRLRKDNCFLLKRLIDNQSRALKEVAVTVEPDVSEVNVFHLSDLQFGITAESSKKNIGAIQKREKALEEKLLYHLQNEIPKDWIPDIIVISGDLAWSATESDYRKFGNWLKRLLNVLHIPIQNVILCTGNHDINFLAAEDNSDKREKLTDEEFRSKVKTELIPEAAEGKIYEKFSEFISFCKGRIDSEIVIEPLMNLLVKKGVDKSESQYIYGYRDILGLRFNVLNTSWYCGENKMKKSSIPDKNKLWIGKEFVDDLILNLENNDKYSVTVFHHPFDWINPKEGDDNAVVKKKLLKFSDIILCGHVHTKVGEPTFEHNRAQIFQSGALWEDDDYTYESRIIKINKRTGLIRQLTIEYDTEEEEWKHNIRKGPNTDYTYPINITKHPEGQFGNHKMRGVL